MERPDMKPVESFADAKERLLIPVKEASAWLGIPVFTLYSWAQSHRIPHYKLGKRVMFSKEDLKKWIEEHHQKGVS
jgi:excisionase family DNA binding protein